MPGSQSAEEAAAVIVDVIKRRRADVYTREGFNERVKEYYAAIAEDP
jgi:hypothetical protein